MVSVPQKEEEQRKSQREELSLTEIQKKKCKKVTEPPFSRCAQNLNKETPFFYIKTSSEYSSNTLLCPCSVTV